jgi:outer membrane protein assembly factor BamB
MRHPGTSTQRCLGILICVLVACSRGGTGPAAGGPAGGDDSGGYRGPMRNGIHPSTGLIRRWPDGGPPLAWSYDRLGPGWAGATVAGDTVWCLGGTPGFLHAFDLATGALRYRIEYGPEFRARFDGTRSTATVVGNRVVFASGKKDERSIYCHDATTGRQLWHVDGNVRFGGKEQGWGYNESPLVVDGKVVFCLRSKDAVCPPVVALDLATGETVWTAAPAPADLSAGDCSPVLIEAGGQRRIIAHLWRAILGIDPTDGRVAWKIDITKGTILTPIFAEGHLLLAGGEGIEVRPVRDDLTLGEPRWTAPIQGICQAVVVAGKVFGFASIATPAAPAAPGKKPPPAKRVLRWVCHDLATGRLLKSEPCLAEGSIAAADGMVFIVEGGESHWRTPRVSLLEPTADGYELAGQFTPPVGTKELWVQPVIGRGRLFIRQGDRLSCFDLRGGGR